MTSLPTSPYKGTRDYYPEDKRVQNYIFSVWQRVCERFGYEEYGAPLLEPLEVYAAKTGQEIVGEQTYRFTDRGEREVVIRPEMTPSISRMVAARRQELAYPARLYNIANFMRYERPQRGREREFWQLNADIFGAEGSEADAEIIVLSNEIMKAFGAKPDMYQVKLNSRKLIDAMMHDYLGLDAVQAQLMIKLFDRKEKLANEEFRDQAIDIFGAQDAPDGLSKIAAVMGLKSVADLPQPLAKHPEAIELENLFAKIKARGVTNAVFDITLMRGFDYYTGTVFEFFDTHPDNNRAMFGGGRYDGLVGLFGAEPITAVGVAPGLSMTELFLATHQLLPDLMSTTEVYVVVLSEDSLDAARTLTDRLRLEGVNTELDFTGRKLDRQIKTALKKRIPFMVFVGQDDVKSEMYNLKDTVTSKEEKLSFERIVSAVKDRRRNASSQDDDLLD
jgi:histidyl-tRNA synthetase